MYVLIFTTIVNERALFYELIWFVGPFPHTWREKSHTHMRRKNTNLRGVRLLLGIEKSKSRCSYLLAFHTLIVWSSLSHCRLPWRIVLHLILVCCPPNKNEFFEKKRQICILTN